MRVKFWLILATMLATMVLTMAGCGGANMGMHPDDEWVQDAAQDCEDISPILCQYVEKTEDALDDLMDRAESVSSDVSKGMPEALRARAALAVEFAEALQAYAVPSEKALGLSAATQAIQAQCVEECIRTEQAALLHRVSGQVQGSAASDLVDEMRASMKLSCQPGKGSKADITESCLARLNPAHKARTWLLNRSDDRYRMPFKALVRSIPPVQQLVLFKVEMALKFASLSDKELDALYYALVAAKDAADKFIRFTELTHRAMPLRVLDPVDQWTNSLAEITTTIDTAAKQCGSGCSPAWREAAAR